MSVNSLPSPKGIPTLWLPLDALVAVDGRIMGRQSAGQGMMRAFTAHYVAAAAPLKMVCELKNRQAMVEQVQGLGWRGELQLFQRDEGMWKNSDLLYMNAPVSSNLARQRSRTGAAQTALCGVTHTVSSAVVIEQIADYMLSPFQPWDALICTSSSVVSVVEKIWAVKLEELHARFGQAITRPPMPQLPVIPLGVHWQDYQHGQAQRQQARTQFGIADDVMVVLFVGRLSIHAKANPVAMYAAIAEAARSTGKKLLLLECGWFAVDAIQPAFDELAMACGINVLRVDGNIAGVTSLAYAAADIFCSFSDNIQESFGLTPIEAMASGLPVVVSDWDGYKDTVRDGVDGFRVRTVMPSAAAAHGLVEKYIFGEINYDYYIGKAHVLCAVDIAAATRALVALIINEPLRRQMGEAGRARTREVYHWPVIMQSYHELWREQCNMLEQARSSGKNTVMPNAQLINPLDLFRHFACEHLTPASRITLVQDAAFVSRHRQLKMWQFLTAADLPETDELLLVLQPLLLAPGGLTLAAWQQQCGMPLPRLERVAIWLMKTGSATVEIQPLQ